MDKFDSHPSDQLIEPGFASLTYVGEIRQSWRILVFEPPLLYFSIFFILARYKKEEKFAIKSVFLV